MSLYIGNLSSRIRRDELERVFQRFGRCNVRMKDGYGFVVYDFPPNAEKALRALQKRYICGEPLTLGWSNKQPRPFKRLARAAGLYENQHERHSVKEEDNVKGKLGPNDRDHGINVKLSDGISREHVLTDMNDKEAVFDVDDDKDNLGQENHGNEQEFSDDGGRFEPHPVGNDRWGDYFHDQPNENTIEFERYEPSNGYNRKLDDGVHELADHGSSPALLTSPKHIGRDRVDGNLRRSSDVKLQVTCYRCGGSGHKMRNCQENSSHSKSTRFDSRHDNDIHRRGRGGTEMGKFGYRSWERQLRKDAEAKRRFENDVKSSGLGKHHRPTSIGSSPVRNETGSSWKKNYEGNKRSRNEIGSSERYTKKTRSFLSSPHSDYTAPQSCLKSLSTEHVKSSHHRSRSKSVSSRAHSSSSESRSISTSHYSRSKRSKSTARSNSHTSLSVSLGQPLPSSSNKAQLNLKGSSDNATTPESKTLLIELEQLVGGDSGLEDKTIENRMVIVNDENGLPLSKAEDELKEDQPQEEYNDDHPIASGSLHELTDLSTTVAKEKGKIESPKCLDNIVCQNSDELMMEHVPGPMENPDSKPPVSSCSGNSTSISSEELSMVLKHYYGLNFQNENERHLPADEYFGSARLWPWEVIYYRRLKKGPISIENYARRIDQNREFHIVDKYIRSSSGWGELEHKNP